jgi:hypothetical protein
MPFSSVMARVKLARLNVNQHRQTAMRGKIAKAIKATETAMRKRFATGGARKRRSIHQMFESKL